MSRNYRAEAIVAAERLGIDLTTAPFTIDDLAEGIKVEYEHGLDTPNSITNVTMDDPDMTAKIAYRHLLERPDYYKLLEVVEQSPISGIPMVDNAIISVQKIRMILQVVMVLLLLLVVVMVMQTAGYEKLSPLKVARVK
ncbi:hypothetical protein F-VV57_0406 [Faustovirus]|nr:hypothetical protein F-VV57_0406 [Faustovirus]QJX73674.1 hypothetical protein F-VV63_0408 [Faustovirus]